MQAELQTAVTIEGGDIVEREYEVYPRGYTEPEPLVVNALSQDKCWKIRIIFEGHAFDTYDMLSATATYNLLDSFVMAYGREGIVMVRSRWGEDNYREWMLAYCKERIEYATHRKDGADLSIWKHNLQVVEEGLEHWDLNDLPF